ncbi:hypothetical protein ACE6H2_021638 [Prunus campanulata]
MANNFTLKITFFPTNNFPRYLPSKGNYLKKPHNTAHIHGYEREQGKEKDEIFLMVLSEAGP